MKLLSASTPLGAAALELPAPARAPALLTHLWLPLAVVVLLSLWLMVGGGDQRLADALYQAQGGHWAWKNAWLTQQLIHRGGRYLSTLAAMVATAAALCAWLGQRRDWRWPLTLLAASVALSTGLVALLKSRSGIDCPWDLSRYGGREAFHGLLDLTANLGTAGCFPAGHAGAGYAWVALYFFALAVRPRWRWAGLALGLGAGLLFGVAQQLRGAHFLSHDLWSLAVCWTVPLLLFRWMPTPGVTGADA